MVRLCIPFTRRDKGLWEWSEETDVDPGTNRAGGGGGGGGGEVGGGRGRGDGRVLHTHSVPVDLCWRSCRERAAGGSGGARMRGARSLCGVPPHTDVLPSSLEGYIEDSQYCKSRLSGMDVLISPFWLYLHTAELLAFFASWYWLVVRWWVKLYICEQFLKVKFVRTGEKSI